MKKEKVQSGLQVVYIPKDKRRGYTSEGWKRGTIMDSVVRPDETVSVRINNEGIQYLHYKDIFFATAPWVLKYPPYIALSKEQLENGKFYVNVEGGPSYIFKYTGNLFEVPYIMKLGTSQIWGCHSKGGWNMATGFTWFREATDDEQQNFTNLCGLP